MTDTTDPTEAIEAPHGRDENGVPLAPYGYKADGNPRKSNRGAAPGQRGNTGAAAKKAGPGALSATDKKRVQTLVGLGQMGGVMPLIGLSVSPQLAKRIGQKHADALAGDAVILSQFLEPFATSLVVIGQTKPSMLSFLDTMEEKAPYVMLANVGMQMAKAFIGNHMNPNERLNNAGRLLAQVRAAELAQEIEQQARAMGIPTEIRPEHLQTAA